LQIPTLKQRDDAFAIAQRLLNEGYIKCVTSRSKMFKDGYVFYSVTKYVALVAPVPVGAFLPCCRQH
jgi:hypothetical protein